MAGLMIGFESRDSPLISLLRLFRDAWDEVITRKRYVNIGYVKFETKDMEEMYHTTLEFWKFVTSEIDQCIKDLTEGENSRNLILTAEILEKKLANTYLQKLNKYNDAWLLFHYFPLKREVIAMLERYLHINNYSSKDKLNKILHEKLIKALQNSPSNCHDPEMCQIFERLVWNQIPNFSSEPNNPPSRNLNRRNRSRRLRARQQQIEMLNMAENIAPRFQTQPQQINQLYPTAPTMFIPMYVPVAVPTAPTPETGFYAQVPEYSTENSLINVPPNQLPQYPINMTYTYVPQVPPTVMLPDYAELDMYSVTNPPFIPPNYTVMQNNNFNEINIDAYNNQFNNFPSNNVEQYDDSNGEINNGNENEQCYKTHCDDVHCDYEYCDDENCPNEHCNNEECDCEHCDYELCEDEFCNDENCNKEHYYENSRNEQPIEEEPVNDENLVEDLGNTENSNDEENRDKELFNNEMEMIDENEDMEGKENNEKFDD